MTKGAKKSVRRWISALVSSRSSITIMGDSMLSLQCTWHLRHILLLLSGRPDGYNNGDEKEIFIATHRHFARKVTQMRSAQHCRQLQDTCS